jgi:hypothetical protein
MKCCVQFLVILAQPSSGCLFGLIGKRDRDWVRWRERETERQTQKIRDWEKKAKDWVKERPRD